jgi:RNA polymerase sigma factor (sigma-70 family)
MVTNDGHDPDTAIRGHLAALVATAGTPDAETAKVALIELTVVRTRALARRMLSGSPQVRRWAETDDVVQSALLRLYRSLGAVAPNDPRHFVRLAALQVRRELIDLTRRFRNPESFAANHDTNAIEGGGQRTDAAAADEAEEPGRLLEWTRFHETVDALSEYDRELFEMVWYLGLSQDEIAGLLGCSPRTVRRRWDDVKRDFTATFRADPPE